MTLKSADLPEWFDLEKYRGCAEFGPVEWYACIRARASVLPHVQGLRYLEPDDFSPIRAKLAALRARPLVARLPRDLGERQAVRFATWDELGKAARLDRIFRTEQAAMWDALANTTPDDAWGESAPPEGELWIPGWFEREPAAAVAIVNLAATDAVLKAEFNAWLAKARAACPPQQPTRNRPAVDRWADYGLLPYIDLAIWSLETDTEISEAKMAAAIYGDQCAEPDKIGDTVAPLARALMADLSPLRALAAKTWGERVRAHRRRP